MTAPLTTTFTARPGDLMTVEVGVITGEVELESTLVDGACRHRVRYVGADEWYRIEGEDPAPADGPDEVRRRHESLVGSLRAPQGDGGGAVDPPHGSQQGRDADDPAAGSFGGARRG